MGEETIICPICKTEHAEGTVQCFNCGNSFVNAPSEPESEGKPASVEIGTAPEGTGKAPELEDQQEESQPESTEEVAGETSEGEQVTTGGAVSKLKSIFSRGEKIEVKAEDAEDPQAVEVKTGEMSGEPQNSQEDKPVE